MSSLLYTGMILDVFSSIPHSLFKIDSLAGDFVLALRAGFERRGGSELSYHRSRRARRGWKEGGCKERWATLTHWNLEFWNPARRFAGLQVVHSIAWDSLPVYVQSAYPNCTKADNPSNNRTDTGGGVVHTMEHLDCRHGPDILSLALHRLRSAVVQRISECDTDVF